MLLFLFISLKNVSTDQLFANFFVSNFILVTKPPYQVSELLRHLTVRKYFSFSIAERKLTHWFLGKCYRIIPNCKEYHFQKKLVLLWFVLSDMLMKKQLVIHTV